MSVSPPNRTNPVTINLRRLSVYQKIVVFAVLHSLALFGFGIAIFVANNEWVTRLWVALATLWFFWPVVLVLHSRGSLRRLVASIALSIALPVPFFRMYNEFAASVFGWPDGFSIMPRNAFEWTHGYLAGRSEAKRDLNNGHLALEEIYLGFGSASRRMFRDRYSVELKLISDVVTSQMLGHQYGYNAISTREFARRYGPNALETAFEEGRKLDREDEERSQQRAKDLAKTLSSIPQGSKVSLESVFITDGHAPVDTNLSPTDMQSVVKIIHWLETLIRSAVPADAPAFDSQVWADLTSTARPELQITSSASAPRGIHMQIYNNLGSVPDVRCENERIRITMLFQISGK
jgi:hypothetical protein